METIKFRVRDIKTREVIGYEHILKGVWHREYTGENHQVSKWKIGTFSKTGKAFLREQYTGLKDINKEEIYERDIVKVNGFTGEVYWYRDGWFIQFEEYSERLGKTKENYIEVIGNIYANKNLIK